MENLIPVNYDSEQPTVSARDLHEGLGINTDFRKWFPRMTEYAIKLDKAFKRARANYLEAFAELTEVKEAYDKASTSDRPEFFFR